MTKNLSQWISTFAAPLKPSTSAAFDTSDLEKQIDKTLIRVS